MHKPDLVDLICNDKSYDETERRSNNQVQKCIFENLPEHGIIEEFDIVVEPRPCARAQQVPFLEGYQNGIGGRIKPHDDVENSRHGEKTPGPKYLLL